MCTYTDKVGLYTGISFSYVLRLKFVSTAKVLKLPKIKIPSSLR